MPKKSLSSLELAAIVNELQFIVKGKISKIYNPEGELFLQLYVPSKGKQLLKIIPGKIICLTTQKESVLQPSSLCLQLRKRLDNAIIHKFYQKDSERILIFELEKEQKYNLIIEMFSKGNVILTDEKYHTIAVWEQQAWKDRLVKVKEKYVFPAPAVNWKELSEKELFGILKKSEKKNLATSLATEVGLGGLYSEEICKLAGIDKDQNPKEVAESEIKKIVKGLQEFLKLVAQPSGYIYEEEVTPFPLSGITAKKTTPTYSEALDTINPFVKKSPYEKKIASLERMIQDQEESIKQLEEKILLNKAKGEKIYEQYTPLQKLLVIVKELKKNKDWKDIAVELKKEKKIKSIDLKNKKITIDL